MQNTTFARYPLSNEILDVLRMLQYTSPTPVQQEVIPAVLKKKDIVVQSQTGSGKTAAFAIPICQLIHWEENTPQALVITPTRELAIQVKEDFFHIGRLKRLKIAAIFGKSPFRHQQEVLKQKTHVVVGTPGRIIDHLERGTLDTSNIQYLVIDEADEMLRMGFIEQVEAIIACLPDKRVTLLFSATMPKDILPLCTRYMKDAIYVKIDDEDAAADRIAQERYLVAETEKIELLQDLSIVENPDSCIIFCNTKQQVDEVYKEMAKQKYSCAKIHGDMEQTDRLKVMQDFKQGLFRYLIATDVAARGIDISDITLVINYDVPRNAENYVHRIGRTGRANKTGKAITFATPQDEKQLHGIHAYIGKEMGLKERPSKETVRHLIQDFNEKHSTTPIVKEAKGAEVSKGIVKLHVNAGKKTKMRPVDIVGTLCSLEGITAEDIGIIQILDVSTFVEILNNKGESALKQLQNKPIKGRLRKVSITDREI